MTLLCRITLQVMEQLFAVVLRFVISLFSETSFLLTLFAARIFIGLDIDMLSCCCRPTPVIPADPGGGGDAKRITFLERMCAEVDTESVGRRGTLGNP